MYAFRSSGISTAHSIRTPMPIFPVHSGVGNPPQRHRSLLSKSEKAYIILNVQVSNSHMITLLAVFDTVNNIDNRDRIWTNT